MNKIQISISQKPYNSLDICKFLMAIFVIAIHTTGLTSSENFYIQSVFRNITDLAVPFFFMASSFLLKQKIRNYDIMSDKLNIIKAFILKMIRLYVIWSIIYLPFAVYGYIINRNGLIKSIISYFKSFILVGEHYYSWPLWYMLATIYSSIILYYIIKFSLSLRSKIIICIVLFLTGQLFTFYMENNSNTIIYKLIKVSIGNGRLIAGMSFFILGFIIAEQNIMLKKKMILPIFLIIMAVMLLSYNTIIWYILKILVSFCFFEIVLSINISKKIYMRKSSTIMYFTHMIPFFIYSHLNNMEFAYGLIGFIVTLIATLGISGLVIVLPENKISKQLFS